MKPTTTSTTTSKHYEETSDVTSKTKDIVQHAGNDNFDGADKNTDDGNYEYVQGVMNILIKNLKILIKNLKILIK